MLGAHMQQCPTMLAFVGKNVGIVWPGLKGLFNAVRCHDQMCVRKRIELSSISQRPSSSSIKISGNLSLAAKKKQQ